MIGLSVIVETGPVDGLDGVRSELMTSVIKLIISVLALAVRWVLDMSTDAMSN